MVDSIYADPAHVDDPHLWRRATELGLELERFDADRRSAAVAERVRADFEAGIRAGITGTPTAFAGGSELPRRTRSPTRSAALLVTSHALENEKFWNVG